MHCRDISDADFDRIVAELVGAKRQGDGIEVVTGRHDDHGDVVLLRDATRCMVLVDDPTFLDMILNGGAVSDIIRDRAMRTGRLKPVRPAAAG